MTPLASGLRPGGATPPVSDDLANAWRRLDWRFLLPDPGLGRVACLAPGPAGVADALARCGFQVACGTPTELSLRSAQSAVFDTVVLDLSLGWHQPDIAAAVSLVRPGGWLYAEAHGPALPWAAGRAWAPGAASRHLATLGLEQVTPYWLWPDRGRATQLVALDNPSVVRLALARGGRGPAARARARAGRWLLATGLLPLAVRCLGLVAQRPVETGP